MTIESFPDFRYHPDPVATGSVVASGDSCDVCGQVRGYLYDGPIYADDDQLLCCPWCIADGAAARKHAAEFTGEPGWNEEDVPAAVAEVIRERTPGFTGWQQERWLAHHGDAAAFVGAVGITELRRHGDAAVAAVRAEAAPRFVDDPDPQAALERHLDALDADASPTAYLFRCLHCPAYLAYSDSDSDGELDGDGARGLDGADERDRGGRDMPG